MKSVQFVTIAELEEKAKEVMTQNAFQYYRSGANEEFTLRDNIEAFKRIKLNPRALRDVSYINLNTTILGHQVSMPIGIAPTAMQKLCGPGGENISAQVAFEKGIPFTLSTLSTTSIDEVARSNQSGFRIMQLYIQKDRELTKTLVKQAELNGFHALALTVDAPVLGKREADERQKFVLPPPLNLQILYDIAQSQGKQLPQVSSTEGSGLLKFFASELDQTLQWKDIDWLRSITKLPIILKGIQSWEDAILAKDHGVAAVWVSNHGGRQLDTVRSTIDILPEIVKVLENSNVEVYVDGGVQRGSDVFKCLALGAKCVFLGRPVLYSLALGQKEGVERMLQIMTQELEKTMQLAGVDSISKISNEYIVQNTIPKPNL